MHHWNEKFNFKVGHPPDETASVELTRKAINHAYDRKDDNYIYRFLNYGHKQGDLGLRQEISKWWSDIIKFKCNPDNMVTSNGCSHGFDMVVQALVKPGDNVLMEGPTYYLFNTTMTDHYANVTTILRKEDGTFDLDLVEKIIVEKKIKLFYYIATFHNPCGTHLPLEQRNKLYNIAMKHKCYICVDDVYELFYYDHGKNKLPFNQFCSDENLANPKLMKEVIDCDNNANPYMISINSFNKLINPGFRLGWIIAHKDVCEKLISIGYIASGGGVNNTMNQFVRSFLELGYMDEVVKVTRDNFRNRIEKADLVLKGSDAYTYDYPTGGYFFWLKLSDKVDLEALKKSLKEEDVVVLMGEVCVMEEARSQDDLQFLKRRMRLCFTRYPVDKICEGFALVRKHIEAAYKK